MFREAAMYSERAGRYGFAGTDDVPVPYLRNAEDEIA